MKRLGRFCFFAVLIGLVILSLRSLIVAHRRATMVTNLCERHNAVCSCRNPYLIAKLYDFVPESIIRLFEKVETVDLSRGRPTQEDLKFISTLVHLYGVSLARTSVTDEDLASLVALPKLETLVLRETQVSDKAIEYLPALMPRLENVSLVDTKVSAEAIDELQRRRPNLRIIRTRGRK